eukprot:CAMPEP_0197550170 /NCGR_PEP_ID=MMETSP1320-20131121/3858_1 /TAXON_ID=91990 /ORGANISM="Bolidomonas sp., Strain RCC2347" /LENGTH=169 /DNA_ID=CAMNT_0043110507 /DNA_START=126 /DNA_END=631 /DNA_ORIENTATION=-
MATSALIFVAGDTSAQYIEYCSSSSSSSSTRDGCDVAMSSPSSSSAEASVPRPPFALDIHRLSMMTSWSLLIYTPLFYALYRRMDALWPAVSALNVGRKVGVAFLFAAPINAAFFCYGAFYPPSLSWPPPAGHASRSYRAATEKIRDDLLPTVKASAGFWWPANALNFA